MRFHAKTLFLSLSAGILFTRCDAPAGPMKEPFSGLSGEEVRLDLDKPSLGTVLFFLSPSCPLCQNYTLTINRLRDSVPVNEIAMVAVFPGMAAEPDSVKAYMERYSLDADQVILDPGKVLCGYYEATVTPEAILLDRDGKKLYKGRIDNWAAETGTKRMSPSSHELRDAIDQLRTTGRVMIPDTRAVGCFIE